MGNSPVGWVDGVDLVPTLSHNGKFLILGGYYYIAVHSIVYIAHFADDDDPSKSRLTIRLMDNSSCDTKHSNASGWWKSYAIDSIRTAAMPTEYNLEILERMTNMK